MKRVKKRALQILRHGPRGLLRLGYNMWVAPWAHVAALLPHELKRRRLQHAYRTSDLERRRAVLQDCFERRSSRGSSVTLAILDPVLEARIAPLRRGCEEIVLAELDQDGLALPCFESLWDAPQVESAGFMTRSRSKVSIVDRDGVVGVRKAFGDAVGSFLAEIEVALDLHQGGCNVPSILDIDWDRRSVTFEFIHGQVVREALAGAGAALRDREVENPASRASIGRKQEAAKKVLPQVFDATLVARIGEELLAIHRAGYVLTDVKYGNIIIQDGSCEPFFIDFESALPLAGLSRAVSTYIRDHDVRKFNAHFATDLPTADGLRAMRTVPGAEPDIPGAAWGSHTGIYAPIEVGAGIRWGPIWNTDVGVGRWRFIMADNLPIPQRGSLLDVGANNGFNALQMLRAGAGKAIAVEIDPRAIEQGEFLKRVYEWSDNRSYDLRYVQGSHGDLPGLDLPPRFDMVSAFCTLYYLDAESMGRAVDYIATMTDLFVMQCNTDRLIDRTDSSTFERASIEFTEELMQRHGFPNIEVVAPGGYSRPLVIGRK